MDGSWFQGLPLLVPVVWSERPLRFSMRLRDSIGHLSITARFESRLQVEDFDHCLRINPFDFECPY